MTRAIVDAVIEEKAQLLLEVDAELQNPELAEIHGLLREEQRRVIDGELEQLTLECAEYWCLA